MPVTRAVRFWRDGRVELLLFFPREQAPLPFKRADAGAILHHLHHSPEGTVLISHRHVDDIDKQTGFIDPELRLALFAGTEFLDNLLHHVEALGRVAVAYFSPDNPLATREHPLFGIGVELHQ